MTAELRREEAGTESGERRSRVVFINGVHFIYRIYRKGTDNRQGSLTRSLTIKRKKEKQDSRNAEWGQSGAMGGNASS